MFIHDIMHNVSSMHFYHLGIVLLSKYFLKHRLVKYTFRVFFLLTSLFISLYSSLLLASPVNESIPEAEQAVSNQNLDLFIIIFLSFSVCIMGVLIMLRGAKHSRELELLTSTDELTGLANRRQIIESLTNQISQSQKYKTEVSIAMVDLDWFKQVNDKYGYFIGDKALKLFANLCTNNLRQADLIGRVGGDKFLLVLPYTGSEEAYHVMENLRLKMTELIADINLPELSISISAGICECQDGDNIEQIMKIADTALYRAKQNGRDQVVVSDRRANLINL